ncbi:MAG: FAD-dependent oxidoreductase [Candidatus Acidiferrales bacterium]
MLADVVIVGGGPAGVATAIAASQKGLRVTLIDPQKPPIDKSCGEGLLPEAVSALRSIGILLDSSSGFPFTGIRFSDEVSSASARINCGQAFGVRRTTLHRLLVNRAAEVGVRCLWGVRVSGLDSGGIRVKEEPIRYKWLVGADGQNSLIRQWARLGPRRHKRSRFGFCRHYRIAPWSGMVEVYWGKQCQLFVTPTGSEEVCLALLSSDPHLRMDGALPQFPDVASRVQGVPKLAEFGGITALGRAHAVVRGNVALVGDASRTIDGIAGQGLSLAFQEAVHLGEALAYGDLASYESAHRRITRTATRMTQLLLLMDQSTWTRRKALRLFASQPMLFSKMISIHTGEQSPESLGAWEILDLGRRVLWA